MTDITSAILDPELGATTFQVDRTLYRRSHGSLVPTPQTAIAEGTIHPGPPEMLQLMPEEERQETFLVIYTSFPLTAGVNESGDSFRAADRIHYASRLWRVVRVRDWSQFGYVQALAVLVQQDQEAG